MKKVNGNDLEFERKIRQYLKLAREKLNGDLIGTREAIKLIAKDKIRCFMETMDKGLSKEERDFLQHLIVTGMNRSFCYGYGIGKLEGDTKERIIL